MADQLPLAFEFAADLSKQLITISTGLLALSITFVKDIIKHFGRKGRSWLLASWVCLLLSILAGVWHLAALTGSLAPVGGGTPEIGSNARWPAAVQELAFVFGMVFLVVYGWRALRAASDTSVAPSPSA